MKQPENCPSLKRTKNEKALILKNQLENICEDKLKTDPVRIVPPTTDSKTKWALRYFALLGRMEKQRASRRTSSREFTL